MMRALEARAEALARRAERRKLEEIAGAFRANGLVAEVRANTVVTRGRAVLRTWLSDPLLRFAGRKAA